MTGNLMGNMRLWGIRCFIPPPPLPHSSGECRSSQSHASEHIKATCLAPFCPEFPHRAWPRPKREQVRGNPPIDTGSLLIGNRIYFPLSRTPAVEMFKGNEADIMYDVIICGAGPTGVFLAAYLSRAGDVKVVNCHAYLRSRSC